MYLMMLGLIMDGHDSLTLTSLSILLRYVNVLYMWTLFFTAEHVLFRMVTPSPSLSGITLYSRF
jgi:hypothetical protein